MFLYLSSVKIKISYLYGIILHKEIKYVADIKAIG